VPKRLSGYARRAFDQGLGRCLWFIDCADVARLPKTITGFAAERQADLWSGVGLAGVYAGGADADALQQLHRAADAFRPCLAQGAAFAAKARLQSGTLVDHTRLACEIFCRMSPEDAALLTDAAAEGLPEHGAEPAYEIWRKRIEARFR